MINEIYLQKLGYSSISALIEAVARQELSIDQLIDLV